MGGAAGRHPDSAGIPLPTSWGCVLRTPLARFARSRPHPLKLAGIFPLPLLKARVPRMGGGAAWGRLLRVGCKSDGLWLGAGEDRIIKL